MSRTDVILADLMFVLVSGMIYETDGLKNYPIILSPLMIIAFITCIVRHINYYNVTNKIY
jgi:cytochrome c oxidase subunit IV